MMIKGGKIHKVKKKSLKAKGKGKASVKENDKQVYIPKPKNHYLFAKEHPAKDDTYHHCKEVGHWKRNCPVYLAELLKKKKQVGFASSLGILTIELFAFPNKYWVYDTGCGTQICITKQGFREARKLKQRALYLYVGNGVDNCHYVPFITRGVVSVHRLVENGFVQCFTDFGISVSRNNVFYFNVIPSNGIYEIDMRDLVPNINFIYYVSTKRAKHNLDSTSLWHYRLAHISKMTRKSFPHRPERATDLLGIIHTDVCGPLRHVSRQGASYFITFTDDYSRYGYVYLLKHKHEVFETFKVFKNEVENQLGKTIKALRSDQGGEYISQEFKDYLKACGIVQQLTPPYTPQHNGVSERRNRTLLDMVRSMMNLTTLPLSFWDYALESVTRILNMVPTKKGCEALMKRDTPAKLQQISVKCIFIGYPKETMGFCFYFPPKKIVVARYAEFFEKNLITQEVSGRAMDLEEIQDEDTS
ncbi:retrotransposon protein, putative, ty1-copia subclass [Tanacetum coccineum]|uniref:Retrotransposon protein, putative, ty1-copia subclass n=1 Tax=Tanacetum coccineum TaxID=301880 RepID=A0ABQ5C110_9ASTR